jgi:large subunit ribosomal protein L21
MDYAVVRTGGKQYRVSSGDVIDVEKLSVEEGARLELTDVLLISYSGEVSVGFPNIPGAKVLAEVEIQKRGEKIVVFRYKAKTRQGTKTGHRQSLTRLRITDIVTGRVPRTRRRRPSQESTEESSNGS